MIMAHRVGGMGVLILLLKLQEGLYPDILTPPDFLIQMIINRMSPHSMIMGMEQHKFTYGNQMAALLILLKHGGVLQQVMMLKKLQTE